MIPVNVRADFLDRVQSSLRVGGFISRAPAGSPSGVFAAPLFSFSFQSIALTFLSNDVRLLRCNGNLFMV